MRALDVDEDRKPETGYGLWTWPDVKSWLLDEWSDGRAPEKIEELQTDPRCHVQIGLEGVAEEGKLFTTEMVSFERYPAWQAYEQDTASEEWSLLCCIDTDRDTADLNGPGPLGGEHRMAVIEPDSGSWPVCPTALMKRLSESKQVRLVLATPGVFEYGWRPQWLDPTTKTGSPPGLEGDILLKLVAACVPRRQPVSGWDYSKRVEGDAENPGRPKPVRWTAPAGSVYFFEVVEGDAGILAEKCWLESVSDIEHNPNGLPPRNNRNDGFGLALWGVWSDKKEQSR